MNTWPWRHGPNELPLLTWPNEINFVQIVFNDNRNNLAKFEKDSLFCFWVIWMMKFGLQVNWNQW